MRPPNQFYEAHALGIKFECDMCQLHDVEARNLRELIEHQGKQLRAAADLYKRRKHREDRMFLAIFALALAVLYFAFRGPA